MTAAESNGQQQRCGDIECERTAVYRVEATEQDGPSEPTRDHDNATCREHLADIIGVTVKMAGHAVVTDL